MLVSEERVKQSIESEIELKKVLDNYSEKYNKLVKSLEQSDSAFERIKGEMARMNGNLIKVESDARKWKKKVDEANAIILKMTAERVEREEAMALRDRQLGQLQELCRRLQGKPSAVPASTDEPNGQSDVCGEQEKSISTSEAATTTSGSESVAAPVAPSASASAEGGGDDAHLVTD